MYPGHSIGIVMIEGELGARRACRRGALPACLVTAARTFALGGDARGRFLLPREVRDRRTRMVIRIGNVDAMVRVNPNLEEVGKAPVGGAR